MLIPRHISSVGEPIQGSEEQFISQGTKLWPPDNAPEDIYDLLCPARVTEGIIANADERFSHILIQESGFHQCSK
jgi:hypothetical protein